jgi:hypothetical protein
MVSWFGPQKQAGFDLSIAPQNRRMEVSVGHASRSSSLLGVEASLTRRLAEARGTMAEVASEAS